MSDAAAHRPAASPCSRAADGDNGSIPVQWLTTPRPRSQAVHPQRARRQDHCRRESRYSEGERIHSSKLPGRERRPQRQVQLAEPGEGSLGGFRGRPCMLLTGSASQAEQCRQAALPLHPRRADAFRPDRVSEAPCLTPLCRQAVRTPGDQLAARRESRGLDPGHQLSQKVRHSERALQIHTCGGRLC